MLPGGVSVRLHRHDLVAKSTVQGNHRFGLANILGPALLGQKVQLIQHDDGIDGFTLSKDQVAIDESPFDFWTKKAGDDEDLVHIGCEYMLAGGGLRVETCDARAPGGSMLNNALW